MTRPEGTSFRAHWALAYRAATPSSGLRQPTLLNPAARTQGKSPLNTYHTINNRGSFSCQAGRLNFTTADGRRLDFRINVQDKRVSQTSECLTSLYT
ncbi:Uncharacterized protein HZ326_24223 [Fusarium oxysporum f. sp. albedinis]|nr:Uncharacterized protein HZ326_24223 [Fusarium oxysporum f. sp. albedinis]